jgi:hypothetical protein
LHVKDQVGGPLAGLQQNGCRPPASASLNKSGMLESDHVSSWFYVVDPEPTLRISSGRVRAIGLPAACTELHICLSNRLSSGRLQNLAFNGDAGSGFCNGILKCERSRHNAGKSHDEASHRATSVQLTDGADIRFFVI